MRDNDPAKPTGDIARDTWECFSFLSGKYYLKTFAFYHSRWEKAIFCPGYQVQEERNTTLRSVWTNSNISFKRAGFDNSQTRKISSRIRWWTHRKPLVCRVSKEWTMNNKNQTSPFHLPKWPQIQNGYILQVLVGSSASLGKERDCWKFICLASAFCTMTCKQENQSQLSKDFSCLINPNILPPNSPECIPLGYHMWNAVQRELDKTPVTPKMNWM